MKCYYPILHAGHEECVMIMMLYIDVLCWNMLDLGENGVMMK